MTDTERDPTRTEDVGEADVEDPGTLKAAFQAIENGWTLAPQEKRVLRSEIERLREERDRWEDEADHNLSIINDLRERLGEAEIERDEMARRASEFQSWGTTCKEERDEALEKLDDYIQHTIEARRKLEEVREDKEMWRRMYREEREWRLEVEEDAARYANSNIQFNESYNRLRRQRDRLREAVREAKNELRVWPGEQLTVDHVQAARDRLSEALDSREDEEDWKKRQCGACGAASGEPCWDNCPAKGCDCPIHGADADEGMTDVQKARCIAYREGFGDGYSYARETDPPDEGEGSLVRELEKRIEERAREVGFSSDRPPEPADDQPGEDGVGIGKNRAPEIAGLSDQEISERLCGAAHTQSHYHACLLREAARRLRTREEGEGDRDAG